MLLLVLISLSALGLVSADAVDYQARNLATISKIYNTTIYPNNLPILRNGSSATPPGLFNQNASGRISPLGNFTGFADSTEYFFALSPNPGQTGPGIIEPNYNAFTSFEIYSYSSSCASVAQSVVYLVTTIVRPGHPDDGKLVSKLKQIATWRFDDEGAVLYYDAWIGNLALWTAELLGQDLSSPIIQTAALATNLCPQIQARCTGANQVYHDTLTCTAKLELKPFGTFDEVWGDNVVCRLVHVVLTQIRPEIHCPHVGPTGGGKCVDVKYDDVYLIDDVALFGSNDAFRCP
ncbi:hypothetical protein CJF30_00009834 [Rutstroemia sp. NJR-2017a BBW]|nr:hypothetical protein CJF30_00009834 [Rutstroemia sp. NJR-2017a BBW]